MTSEAWTRRNIYTVEEFKAEFKVGDTVEGYPSNIRVRITAIGEERFLFRWAFEQIEGVSLIRNKSARWRKPKESVSGEGISNG